MLRVRKTKRSAGFTLLEMMIVVVIMGILMSIALPIYNHSLLRSREAVLRQDLFTLRNLISQYTLDKQKAPQSLDDLVPGLPQSDSQGSDDRGSELGSGSGRCAPFHRSAGSRH